MSMVSPVLQNQQGKYVRARENPFFNGLRRGNTSMINRASPFESIGRNGNQKITRSASVTGHKGYTDDIQENVSHTLLKDSQLETKRESGLPLSGNVDFSSSQIADDIQSDRDEPKVEKPYTVRKRKQTLLGDSLPPCAASFYYSTSPQIDIVESCESILKLNSYLKASKDAVNAGVPGKFLRAVLGQVSDVGSFIATIMYSFYLNETDETSQFCTVPVISTKRQDLNSYADLKWLLNSCNIDQPSLLFIDEVDLSYYDLFGSLKVVLLNADKILEKQEALKESVVEVFNCQKGDFAYSSDDTIDEQDSSCCALIAEKFALTSPEILTGKSFSRLLLAGILLDTGNLTSPKCTSVDRYMSTLLLNGAGRFGCNGLYQILRSKIHDVLQISVGQILQKDFKKLTKSGKGEVGMSAVEISIPQLLSYDETSIQEIVHFQQLEKLRLLIIVSGYDHHKNKKEMLISAESEDVMKDLLRFLNTHGSHLPLHALHKPGLSDKMRAFTVDNIVSRTIMEQVLEDFCRN